MLKISNLISGYDGKTVLKGIDFEIGPAEIVSVIGLNGSGKTTLLKSIYNLCEIHSGNIFLGNEDITGIATYQLICKRVSYVPQGRQIFKNLTVKENLEMGAFAFNNRELIRNNIEKIFTQFPFLEDKQNDFGFNLSGGQQQILSIARALMQNPSLLLLDEPSLGLSPKMTKEIFSIIQKINKEGVSIMLVEQNVKQAVQISDRTYVLENGKIILEENSLALNAKKLKNLYFSGVN